MWSCGIGEGSPSGIGFVDLKEFGERHDRKRRRYGWPKLSSLVENSVVVSDEVSTLDFGGFRQMGSVGVVLSRASGTPQYLPHLETLRF